VSARTAAGLLLLYFLPNESSCPSFRIAAPVVRET